MTNGLISDKNVSKNDEEYHVEVEPNEGKDVTGASGCGFSSVQICSGLSFHLK